MEYIPVEGDRVRFAEDLGGFLKKDKFGIVVEVDPPNFNGTTPALSVRVSIPWVRDDAPVSTPPWNGHMGDKSVTLAQFHRAPVIPMDPSELTYVDHIYTNRRD